MEADLSVIITTFERPWHLRRVLLSLAIQRDCHCRLEVVVADDGSRDETPQVVEEFARQVDFPVRFVTHPHEGFWPARARNEGFIASTGRYLLFLDGDCVIPPDHLAAHMRMRRPHRAWTGDCIRLDQMMTQRMTEEAVKNADYLRWPLRAEYRRLAIAHWKAVFYHAIRHPRKPRVLSGNLAVWRHDFLRINGFDEQYRGWGCEDDDLGLRLHQAGIRVFSIRRLTRTYHLWHPRVESAPSKVSNGLNFAYLHRAGRLSCCRNGLKKRSWKDLHVVWTGNPAAISDYCGMEFYPPDGCNSPPLCGRTSDRPEVEILIWDWSARSFRTDAECRVLVIIKGQTPPKGVVRASDWVLADGERLDTFRPWIKQGARLAPLERFREALEEIG